MARPKSRERRDAILTAATRVIAGYGLGAPTALIAKEAGVSNGSLFTYFETKADLLNQLYVTLKTEMGASTVDGFPDNSGTREQLRHIWTNWLHWAITHPEKRRTLVHLSVSDEITVESRQIGAHTLAGIARLVEKSRVDGPMRDVPLTLVMAVMNAVAEATTDFVMRDPANADAHCATSFEATWRMIT